jgi:outer membrane immunogenic protein
MMMQGRSLSLAALFGLALALPAGAADMRVKAPVAPPPPPPPPFTWTGCYLGGFVGGAFADRDPVFTDLGNGRFGSFSGGITAPGIAGIHSWAVPVDDSFIGGGTLGCNWQFAGSPFVLGIEGEFGYMKFSGAAFDPLRGPNTLVAPFTPDVLGTARIGDWYGMATSRIGYAFNTVLFYVKGGAAFVPVKASVVDNCTTGGCGNWLIATAVDDTATVGTIGGGIEWAFAPNWSMKAEYMFIGLGGHGLTSCGTATLASGAVVPGGDFCFAHDFPDIHTVKLGINWRFGSIFGP